MASKITVFVRLGRRLEDARTGLGRRLEDGVPGAAAGGRRAQGGGPTMASTGWEGEELGREGGVAWWR